MLVISAGRTETIAKRNDHIKFLKTYHLKEIFVIKKRVNTLYSWSKNLSYILYLSKSQTFAIASIRLRKSIDRKRKMLQFVSNRNFYENCSVFIDLERLCERHINISFVPTDSTVLNNKGCLERVK